VSALQYYGKRHFDTADLSADPYKLWHREGRSSFANDRISSGLRRTFIRQHIALGVKQSDQEQKDTAGPDSTQSGSIIGVGGTGSTFISLGSALVLDPAPIALSTVYSATVSGSGLVAGANWTIYNAIAPLTITEIQISPDASWPLEGTWTINFAPTYPPLIASELGNWTNVLTEEDVREMELPDFLDRLYILAATGRAPAAMDTVFDHLDQLLNDGLFRVCDKLLTQVDLLRLPSGVRRALLAVTRPAKQELPSRVSFYEEALRLLSLERGQETARKMLKSLA
jgi:hypothetical protein